MFVRLSTKSVTPSISSKVHLRSPNPQKRRDGPGMNSCPCAGGLRHGRIPYLNRREASCSVPRPFYANDREAYRHRGQGVLQFRLRLTNLELRSWHYGYQLFFGMECVPRLGIGKPGVCCRPVTAASCDLCSDNGAAKDISCELNW